MPRAKAKGKHNVSALAKAVQTQRHSAPTMSIDLNTKCIDLRTSAATADFVIEEIGIGSKGLGEKKASTKSGMKTALGAEAAMNVDRRIRNANVPIGAELDDGCFIGEELSIDSFDVSRSARHLMPRRPAWNYELSSGRLHFREAQGFQTWLADVRDRIAERGGYPPAFEQNLQVWRQLWRVLERCDVAVAVVDARHPLLHLPPALVFHVTRTLQKPLVVVLNKLDMVQPENAARWAQVLQSSVPGIMAVVGFSKEGLNESAFAPLAIGKAALIAACHEVVASARVARQENEEEEASVKDAINLKLRQDVEAGKDFIASSSFQGAQPGYTFKMDTQGLGYYPDPIQNSSTETATKRKVEISEEIPLEPRRDSGENSTKPGDDDGRVLLGLVGHPNVGKSSLVNSLIGDKVVSVKATPGHTKTLQTMILDSRTCLMDSPGVVFPRLDMPRESQIVGMLIPHGQVREPFSAIRWVMERCITPLQEQLNLKPVTLEQVLRLKEEGSDALRLDSLMGANGNALEPGDVVPWSPMLICVQYAKQRGLGRNGRPDANAAGMEILSRVLEGRIPYSVKAPEACLSAEERLMDAEESDDDDDSDWQIDDAVFESEDEQDADKKPKDLMGIFGQEEKKVGANTIRSRKKAERKKKIEALETGESQKALPKQPKDRAEAFE
jgi:ribosome biogenesis GTPase A|mmetsp:Transcript_90623/g.143179  ORF Transcript_90623/g.143179 Transcript_90623/m.143179 type:complete len:671 (-) Transcript_90623:85-2097(-)